MDRRGHLLDRDGLREMRADPGHGFANPPHFRLRVPDLSDTRADRRAQQTNQDLVDDQRPEKIRILRMGHEIEQARHRVDDVVGRAPEIHAATVRHLGSATRVYPRRELSDSRGVQVEHEAEIWIFPTGADHLARERQIHGEDQQVRGIVFEHFTSEHDHLGALRRDAQSGAQGGVGRLGCYSREADGVRARKPQLERPIVGGVLREAIGEPSERYWARGDESRVFAGCGRGSRESAGAQPGTGLEPLRTSKTARVQTSLARRCRHAGNGTSSAGASFAETSDSNARSGCIRVGIGKKRPRRPCSLIV